MEMELEGEPKPALSALLAQGQGAYEGAGEARRTTRSAPNDRWAAAVQVAGAFAAHFE